MGSEPAEGRQGAREAAHVKSGSPATHGPVPDDAPPTGPDSATDSATEKYWESGKDPDAVDTAREANEQALKRS
jgi:hypothetical protein